LKAAARHSYDLIVIDAFSSDSIPTHLLTREAFALYLDKLRPHGVILFNLSNKYLKLGSVLGTVVDQVHAHGVRLVFYPTAAQSAEGASGSEWMVVAAERSDLDFVAWPVTRAEPGTAAWTDDFSNIYNVIQW
jgi:spermidine synthase